MRLSFPASLRHALALGILLLATASAAWASPKSVRLAIRTADADIAAAIADGSFQRFVLPNVEGLKLEVSENATGDVLVEACRLPGGSGKPPQLDQKLKKLPAALHRDALELGGVRYLDPELALAVRLPEPTARHWVVCGFEAESTASVVERVLFQEAELGFRRSEPKVDYLLHEHDYSQRSGQWKQTDKGIELDPRERDDPAHRRTSYAAMPELHRERVTVKVPAAATGDPRAPALADQLERDAAALGKRLGVKTPSSIEVLVEQDHVAQGRHTGKIGAAVISRGRLHVVFHEDDFDLYRFELARLMLRRAGLNKNLGGSPMLEDGAALWLSESWYGRHYKDWIADLVFGDVLPSASELRSKRRLGDGSKVLWPPVAAAIIDRLPGDTLAAKLAARSGIKRLDAHLESGLRTLLTSATNEQRPAVPAKASLPFQRGLSFAMSNGLEVGYHAPGVDVQLERLKAMGADAVSLMPFAYQRNPDKPGLRFLNSSPSSETDVGVIHAARRAQQKGFFVLWKPHIWVSFESWPGDIAMDNEADWSDWWKSYRRFILHHAMLAQFSGADMLSLGIELGRTVSREEEWRHLIAATRRIYDGALTYSGNWWGDYDQAPFWDALDIVGVDAYFPLADSDQADDAMLQAGAERIVKRLAADARKYQKPILLTEVGFAARQGAWVSPHEEGGELSNEHQRRSWAALLEALGKPDWLGGLYAWKVFSHERAERTTRPDFRFLERPAAAELEGWFRDTAGQSRKSVE